jgi:hypothetical protein
MPVAPAPGQESPDDRLRRMMELTKAMTEQNAAGIATDEVVEAVNELADQGDPCEAWPPGALDSNRSKVPTAMVSRTPSHEPRDACSGGWGLHHLTGARRELA